MFPVKFAKFLRTSFLTEHLRWLFLYFRMTKYSPVRDKSRVVIIIIWCWVKFFLSLTCPYSRMCISIYIFNFKNQANKPKKCKKKRKKLKKKIEYLRRIDKKNWGLPHFLKKEFFFWPYRNVKLSYRHLSLRSGLLL